MITNVSQNQWRYLRHWIILIITVEVLMAVFSRVLPVIYITIAALFLAGYLLRVLRLYPGEDEPLVLDFSGVVIALLFALLARMLLSSGWRYLLILCSSLIVFPHFIYIFKEK